MKRICSKTAAILAALLLAGCAELREIPPPFLETAENAPAATLNSPNAALLALDEKRSVLLDKKSRERIYPASMTKIMTAVIALENLPDYEEKITLTKSTFNGLHEAATAGFLPGERVRAIDLLYGLLLPSGAECAAALAERAAGSEAAFAGMMNEKAWALGMSGTNFTNATGLHDKNQYSTVYDVAVLLDYALTNETFYEIFITKRYVTPPTNLHQRGVICYSSMFSKMESMSTDGYTILGGKTGYTDEAGQCLVSLAEKNGERYILATAGARAENNSQTLHIDDAIEVYSSVSSAKSIK